MGNHKLTWQRRCSKPRLAVAWLVDPPSPHPPFPWLAAAGQKRLGGGGKANIKENKAKTATLRVPRGTSHPLLTCGYVCQCNWGN